MHCEGPIVCPWEVRYSAWARFSTTLSVWHQGRVIVINWCSAVGVSSHVYFIVVQCCTCITPWLKCGRCGDEDWLVLPLSLPVFLLNCHERALWTVIAHSNGSRLENLVVFVRRFLEQMFLWIFLLSTENISLQLQFALPKSLSKTVDLV